MVGREYRIVHQYDIVPSIPPLDDYRHVGLGIWELDGQVSTTLPCQSPTLKLTPDILARTLSTDCGTLLGVKEDVLVQLMLFPRGSPCKTAESWDASFRIIFGALPITFPLLERR